MKIGTDIKNWKEYLERKFSDRSIFTIDDKTNDLTNGVYTITAIGNETEISFIWPDKDWLTVDDIQFHNPKVNSSSGEILGGNGPKFGKFNQENINYVEQALETPMKKGWTSNDYFLFGKIFKSVSRDGMNPNIGTKISTEYKFGCVGFLFFPITILIDIALNKGIIGQKKTYVVNPMVE